MAAHEEQIGHAIRIDRTRVSGYCMTVNPEFLRRLNAEKPQTMSQLADIWYAGNGADYHMLNLHASFTNGTGVHSALPSDEPACEGTQLRSLKASAK